MLHRTCNDGGREFSVIWRWRLITVGRRSPSKGPQRVRHCGEGASKLFAEVSLSELFARVSLSELHSATQCFFGEWCLCSSCVRRLLGDQRIRCAETKTEGEYSLIPVQCRICVVIEFPQCLDVCCW